MYIFFVLCKSILSRAQLKHPASTHACQLTHRCVVRVEGEEGRRFLQGMVTVDMEQERETGSAFYSMMLNAQVRQELRGREGGREEGERERRERGGFSREWSPQTWSRRERLGVHSIQ